MNTTPLLDPAVAAGDRSPHRAPSRRFVGHLAQMLVAMLLGMLLLVPVWDAALRSLGWEAAGTGAEGTALAMATTMSIGMGLWMVHQGHHLRYVGEMCLAMYLSLALALVPYWAGVLSADTALVVGHVLMLPAMVAVMLARRTRHEGHGTTARAVPVSRARRVLDAAAHRWPTLLGLGLTFDSWISPGIPSPWLLVFLGTEYLVIGTLRRQFRRDRVLALHVVGFVVYAGLAVLAATLPPDAAAYVVAAGWLLHVGWDAALHRANRIVWRWYAEACVAIDLVLGVTVLLLVR